MAYTQWKIPNLIRIEINRDSALLLLRGALSRYFTVVLGDWCFLQRRLLRKDVQRQNGCVRKCPFFAALAVFLHQLHHRHVLRPQALGMRVRDVTMFAFEGW